ncbi:MAG: hypothetical protein SFV55_07160 [Haliscomenobacter sp.]|uniref:hypothetical protein n=1 Tax=Haliscomenobacter sp. TaxID=2717303 RepID=UPI0029ACE1A7|nr:hypothetical protein [Haliscomenobacter sp.]MDX2068189.1 hypothetical protein [Haliscomenobacter sp.]
MRKLLFFFMVVIGLQFCTDGDAVAKLEDYAEAEAVLINQLPVDGCDWHFGVDLGDEWGEFVPNKSSQPKVDALIKQASMEFGIAQVKVKMRYRLTGTQQEVQCGWNQKAKMEEIDIASIERL